MASNRVAVLYAVGFLDMFAFSLLLPLLFDHLRSLGLSASTVGALGSLHAGLQLISSPIIGSWTDIKGYRTVLQVILLTCSASYLILGTTTSLFFVLLARIAQGLSEHTTVLCGTLLANIVSSEKLSEVQGRFASIGRMGFIVGPIIGGNLAELDNGFKYVCYIVASTFVVNFVIVYFFIPNIKKEKKNSPFSKAQSKSKEKSLLSGIFQALTALKSVDWSTYWDIFLFKLVIDFTMGLHFQNFAIILKDMYDVSPSWIGYVMSLSGIVGAIAGFSNGYISKLYIEDETHTKRTLHNSLAISFAFIFIGVAPNLLLTVGGQALLSAANSLLIITISETILQRTTADQRGSVMGSAQSIMSLAFLIAPICSGLTYELYGPQGMSMLKIGTSLIALSFPLFLFKHKKTNKRQIKNRKSEKKQK